MAQDLTERFALHRPVYPSRPSKALIAHVIKRLRTVVPIGLLAMLLFRLVWLQLRDYEVHLEPRSLMSLSFLYLHKSGCTLDATRSALINDFIQIKNLAAVVEYGSLRSLGSEELWRSICSGGQELGEVIKFNMWVLIAISFVCAAMTRLATSSWPLAIGTSVLVLSRGHLTSQIGVIGTDLVVSLGMTLATTFITYFFVTGSWLAFTASAFFCILFAIIEPVSQSSMLALILFLTLGLLTRHLFAKDILRRLRSERRKIDDLMSSGRLKVYQGGVAFGILQAFTKVLRNKSGEPLSTSTDGYRTGLLSRLDGPFAIWISQKRRLEWTMAASLFCWIAALCFATFSNFDAYPLESAVKESSFWREWLTTWHLQWWTQILQSLDLHLLLSFMALLFCAGQSPAKGQRSVFEVSWYILLSLFATLVTSWIHDTIDLRKVFFIEKNIGSWSFETWTRSHSVILWLEPLILTIGLIGAYQAVLIFLESRKFSQ